MDFRSEASAVVVGLRTAAPDTHVRELTFIRASAAILLELVANLVFVELLMKICSKLEREFHKIVEILGGLTLSCVTSEATSFPALTSSEEQASADRWRLPVASDCSVVESGSVLSPSRQSVSLKTEVPDCLKMMEHLDSQQVATNASCGAPCSGARTTTLTGCRRTVPYKDEWLLCGVPVHTRGNKTRKVRS